MENTKFSFQKFRWNFKFSSSNMNVIYEMIPVVCPRHQPVFLVLPIAAGHIYLQRSPLRVFPSFVIKGCINRHGYLSRLKFISDPLRYSFSQTFWISLASKQNLFVKKCQKSCKMSQNVIENVSECQQMFCSSLFSLYPWFSLMLLISSNFELERKWKKGTNHVLTTV